MDLVYCRQCRPIHRSIQRSIVGRHSVDIAVDSRSIVSRSGDRLSAEYRSIFRRRTSTDYRSYVGDISVNCRSNITRVLIQQVSPMAFFLGNDVINYCYHAISMKRTEEHWNQEHGNRFFASLYNHRSSEFQLLNRTCQSLS